MKCPVLSGAERFGFRGGEWSCDAMMCMAWQGLDFTVRSGYVVLGVVLISGRCPVGCGLLRRGSVWI